MGRSLEKCKFQTKTVIIQPGGPLLGNRSAPIKNNNPADDCNLPFIDSRQNFGKLFVANKKFGRQL